MIEQIDWSEAPAGTTHAGFNGDGEHQYWYKIFQGGYEFASVATGVWRSGILGNPAANQILAKPTNNLELKMKFKVRDVSHGKQIQAALFSLGYTWADGSKVVLQLDAPYLYAGHGVFFAGYIYEVFKSSGAQESEVVVNYVIQDVQEPETIEW